MNKELRSKTNEELIDLIVRLKGQLLQYRFKQAQGELDKSHVIKETRQVLARIYTILHERKASVTLANKINSTMLQPKAADAAAAAKAELLKKRAEKKLAKTSKRKTNQEKLASMPKKEVVKKAKLTKQKTFAQQPKKLSKIDLRNAKSKRSSKMGFRRKGV